MKPICVSCDRFYRMKRAGYAFIESMPTGDTPLSGTPPRPGRIDADKWKPYKLWLGDLWECPDCGSQVVVGVGQAPISEHYKPDFEEKVKAYSPMLKVNDC